MRRAAAPSNIAKVEELSVEVGDAIESSTCECCGRVVRAGRGYVYKAEDAFAAYWFDLHDDGTDPRVRLLVALPDESVRTEFVPDVSFTVEARLTSEGIGFALRDPKHSPVMRRRRVTGRTVSRRRALKSAHLPKLWTIVETIVRDDPAVAAVLSTDDA